MQLESRCRDTKVKKMKLLSIFKNQETSLASWKWPPFSLGTFPFQAKVNAFRNFYFAVRDAAKFMTMLNSPRSQSKTISLAPEKSKDDLLEIAVNKAVRSERLFFEPGNTSSILGDHNDEADRFPFPECVAVALESENPYEDFRNSMEETAENCGLKNWEDAEELLAWYLRMNRKQHHCFIIEAFVDLFSAAPSSFFPCPVSHSDSASSSKSKD
ncbi:TRANSCRIPTION REPRESSOR OFP7-RELATED [Salix viminalis]|uniref:Transcription repressor n=1 Tax=Salix viminalis TaxID=40686 RepID=A0A9Q0NKZ2_SALVM|nr:TRANSCRIPTION REPRESSOR OFP7-RELATED [Salix viminalis]